jgi:ribosomal protein S18 acetylase RimI-like enzyme
MRIRGARTSDWDRMGEIFRSAGRAAWLHILQEELLRNLNPPERWREAIDDAAQRVLVAEDQGQVVGFAVLRRSGDADSGPDTGELDSFYTHPDCWGKGAGRTLLAEGTEQLCQMGFRRATLWTAELNHRPRKIYEAAGWLLDGGRRERSLGGQDFVELRYAKPLNPQ